MGRIVIMVTVSHIVKKLIDNKKFLQEAIQQEVISHHSLAKKLKPEIEAELGEEVKESAIVMASRRYEEKLKNIGTSSFNYFSEIGMRTSFCYIIVNESPSLLPKLSTLYHIIDFKRGGVLSISHGPYQVGIVTNDKYKEKLIDLLKMEDIFRQISDVVLIALTYSKDCTFTPGVLYDVVRFISWENINLLNVLHTPQTLFLYLSEQDALRCYNILSKKIKAPLKKSKYS